MPDLRLFVQLSSDSLIYIYMYYKIAFDYIHDDILLFPTGYLYHLVHGAGVTQ